MTVAKAMVTIFIMKPIDITMGCRVFKKPFRMAYQIGGSWASSNDLGSLSGEDSQEQSVPGWIHNQKFMICLSRP